MYYVPEWYKPYEVVPKVIYDTIKNENIPVWSLFDDRILKTADLLRETYGKIVINTWGWGGPSQYRGWRPWDCLVGAKWSQHKWGRALDLVLMETNIDVVRKDIIDNPYEEAFKFITCLEIGKSWLHIDTRPWRKQEYGLLIIAG